MSYAVVYEDKYIKPGFMIYREDFKQFLKIIPNYEKGGNTFTFIASDETLDNPAERFRIISYIFKEGQPLYTLFEHLKKNMSDGCTYSLNPIEEGINQFYIDKKPGILYVHFIKDLSHSQNLYSNALRITLGGNSIQQFFMELDTQKTLEDKGYVLEKMINLKPKDKDFK
jgi:hypothetical protein